MKPGKLKHGRPSKRTPALLIEICDRLSSGETLADICRSDHMPEVRTVYDWSRDDLNFSANFARAREAGFDVIANDCLAIADDGTNDFVAKQNEESGQTGQAFNAEHVQRSKLRVETRLKLLAKWDPKRYGEKLGLGKADGLDDLALVTIKDMTGRK